MSFSATLTLHLSFALHGRASMLFLNLLCSSFYVLIYFSYFLFLSRAVKQKQTGIVVSF